MGLKLGRWAALVALLPRLGAAAEGDYAVDNTSWNGLSSFVGLIERDGYRYTVERQLDWDAVDPSDVLIFLYPLRDGAPAPDPVLVADFLHRGGRVVLADDFGAAGGSLEALGLTRVTSLPGGLDSYSDNPALPFAEPVPGHSLGAGVDLLLTNHPSALRSDLTPAFVFGRPPASADPNQGLLSVVVEGGLDEGRIIAISDPSIFINAMLSYRGNETFVHNLLFHVAGPAPGRGTLRLYIGRFTEWGDGGEDDAASAISGAAELQEFLTAFNDWLGNLGLYAPRGELGRLMAALLVLAAFAAMLARLAQSAARYDGHWLSGGKTAGPLGAAPRGREAAPLSALFRAEVEDFLKTLETPLPERIQSDPRRARRRFEALIQDLSLLPERGGKAERQKLAALHREWLALLAEADLLEHWRRRGRG